MSSSTRSRLCLPANSVGPGPFDCCSGSRHLTGFRASLKVSETDIHQCTPNAELRQRSPVFTTERKKITETTYRLQVYVAVAPLSRQRQNIIFIWNKHNALYDVNEPIHQTLIIRQRLQQNLPELAWCCEWIGGTLVGTNGLETKHKIIQNSYLESYYSLSF